MIYFDQVTPNSIVRISEVPEEIIFKSMENFTPFINILVQLCSNILECREKLIISCISNFKMENHNEDDY